MKHPFNTLTKADVEKLRRKPMAVSNNSQGVNYNFTLQQLNDARKYLETIYSSKVRATFAAKILLLNEIY